MENFDMQLELLPLARKFYKSLPLCQRAQFFLYPDSQIKTRRDMQTRFDNLFERWHTQHNPSTQVFLTQGMLKNNWYQDRYLGLLVTYLNVANRVYYDKHRYNAWRCEKKINVKNLWDLELTESK